MIKGLILDMDGTLINSHQVHLNAWKILLKKYNIIKTNSEILRLFGKTTERIAKELFPARYDSIKLGLEKDEIFFSLIPDIYPFKGTSELLSRLKQQSYRICIGSSNPIKTIEAIISTFSLTTDVFVGIEDIKNGKPAPDMIITAAARLELPISECLAVGDSIYDVQAAKAAMCKVVAVLTGTQPFEIIKSENPDFILSSILEIEELLKKLS